VEVGGWGIFAYLYRIGVIEEWGKSKKFETLSKLHPAREPRYIRVERQKKRSEEKRKFRGVPKLTMSGDPC